MINRLKKVRRFFDKWAVAVVAIFMLIWVAPNFVWLSAETGRWYDLVYKGGLQPRAQGEPLSIPAPFPFYKWLCMWMASSSFITSGRIVGGGLILFLLYSFLHPSPVASKREKDKEEVKSGQD